MEKIARLRTIRHCCLRQDIEHDGREITNPRDPPGQRCVYIPPGENHCFLAITSSVVTLMPLSHLCEIFLGLIYGSFAIKSLLNSKAMLWPIATS